MMLVNPFRFRGSSPATISYEGTATSGTATTTQTIASVPIGTASDVRTVIQTISWTGVTGITLNSATIGGITADVCVQFSALELGASFAYVAIISADVTTGTTATTALTFSAAPTPAVVESFKAIGLASKTATDTETATGLASTSQTVSPDVLAGGLILAAVYGRANPNFTITGATEAYDTTVSAGLQIAGGYYTAASAELAHAVTFTPAAPSFNGPVAAAAFR